MDTAYRFAAAAPDEELVYGAAAPGWHTVASQETAVRKWIQFMQDRGIERVCCLLPGNGNGGCQYNLDRYAAAFGKENVRQTPLLDRKLADRQTLESAILPFLEESVREDMPVVVQGLSGLGRTGQVLAAWLVYGRQYTPEDALKTVAEMGRFPAEPAVDGSATEDELLDRIGAVG